MKEMGVGGGRCSLMVGCYTPVYEMGIKENENMSVETIVYKQL